MTVSPLRRLLVPIILIVLALLLRSHWRELGPAYSKLAHWLPYFTLGAAGALCLYFDRARLFTAALVLLVVFAMLPQEVWSALGEPRVFLIYSLISLLLP